MEEVCEQEPITSPTNNYVENYNVNIETLDFGYVVRVGCKSFAFETKEKMIEKLLEYLNNPAEKQKQFREKGTI